MINRCGLEQAFENVRGGDKDFLAEGRHELLELVDRVQNLELLLDILLNHLNFLVRTFLTCSRILYRLHDQLLVLGKGLGQLFLS